MEDLQQTLGYTFCNLDLLEESLTHSSYAYEHSAKHNERLEFLGDSVINACTTIMLVEHFKELREGQLSHLRSRLINTATLAEVGRGLGLGEYLKLGKGIESKGGREMTSILADATEAVIGAVFLDSSFATAQRLTQEWLAVRMTTLGTSEERSVGWLDPRGLLQHITQKQFGAPPNYDLIHTKGPDHAPLFTVSATIKGRTLGTGVGPTKRAASRAAAENALDQGDEE